LVISNQWQYHAIIDLLVSPLNNLHKSVNPTCHASVLEIMGKKPKAQTLPPGLKGLVVTAFRAAVWVCQTTSQFQPGTKGISDDQHVTLT